MEIWDVACLRLKHGVELLDRTVIGQAYLKHPDLKTYPEMAAEAVTRFIFGFGGGGGDDDEEEGDADGG